MAEKNTAGTASPVLVRRDDQYAAARARELESELAKVIKFMNQSGITAAGIRITGAGEVNTDRSYVSSYDQADVKRLLSARAAILQAAEATVGLWALPDAMLVLRGVAVTLLGGDCPGTLRDSGRELVPAEEAADR